MKSCEIFLAVLFLYSGRCVNGLLEDTKRILSEFKQKYNNSQSDLIFLMDVSGSVSDYGFLSEKIFVDNILNELSVAPYSTRVAVITFGRNVQTDINFIDIDPLSKEFQKCAFKPLFQHNVNHRYGWATNMKQAFLENLELLKKARESEHKRLNAHTVAIMITDGWWNMGDPNDNAKALRDEPNNVDIFTVGVDGYNKYQLEQLASTPSHVLEFNTFTQFRELAIYIRGDAHDKIFMQVDASKCTVTNGCHSLAFCGCGTVSGVYQCVCPLGYYGTGIPGHCYPCPHGSYKLWPSPDDCIPCPGNSTTDSTGNIDISACRCFTGFKGDPKSGIPCRAVECEQLLAPDNGRFLAPCGHVYNDVCEFECNTGYTLTGTSSRRCQSDTEWSGIHPVCEIITCSVLPAQAHGTMTCTGKGYEYGDSCSFTCDEGYERKGSSVRTCQIDTQWSGQQTTCEARHCPALRQLAFGSVDPVDCVSTTQPYQRLCVMTCYNGYVRIGDGQLTCGADGTWQGVYPTCEDQQPPEITCPSNVLDGTDPERPSRLVTWSDPGVEDNAELHDPNATPTLTRIPKDIVSPYEFFPGTTNITYTATDRSNNSKSCVFTVTIRDVEPPKIYCPQNMEVKKESSKQTIKVYWPPPRSWDNSGQAVTVFTASVNGSDFAKGQYQVTYDATDHVGNKATCSFIILVSAVRCKPYDPPINGSLACSPFFSDEVCTPSCNAKKEFSRIPAAWYSCKSTGVWEVFELRPYVIKDMPWPDCTEEYVPNAARKGMIWQYFTGDCTDPDVQNQIKENFIKTFNEVYGFGDQGFCQRENLCSVDNIKVTCGRTKRRKKRSQSVVEIDVDVSVFTNGGSYDEAKKSLESNVTRVKSSPNMQSLDVPGSGEATLESVDETPTYAVCIEGSVFELNLGTTSKDLCQNCPAGTYYDRGIKNCTKCPLDTYNTYTGQLQCVNCPDKTYTLDIGTKNNTMCLAACQPGEYSPTGLANCEACPINSYQSLLRQSSCIPCPGSSVTLAEGAKSISECGMPCAPGTYSETGVEPCLPCPKGKYQPDTNQKLCLPCDGSKSTYGVGASTVGQCLEIDDCASNPCNNGGQCVNDDTGFYCVCDGGFTGKNCEIEENECTSNPCAQGATCMDKVNGYICLCSPEYNGIHCDVKIDSCNSNKCASGSTCVNSPTGHECICLEGYDGKFCETKINNCNSSPCKNGARCFNENNSYRCECPLGFSGNSCEKNDNGCLPDSCLNGATCRGTSYGHECDCSAGFAGLRCEIDVNECSSAPCQNNGQCIDQVNGYKCLCKPSFYGTNCETEVSTDFDFTFHRSKGRGVSIVEMRQELRAFTIAFWMRVSDTQLDPGTPISYAVQVGETVQDNALVIHDYNGFNIWINGQKASTNVAANDNKWHHIAATWQSATGRWKIYKDGSQVRDNMASEAFQTGQVIPAGGLFVLGQEQDALGANFTASEAFIGEISQLNIWSYELDAKDIAEMGKHANNIIGNVVAWSDFYYRKNDGLNVTMPSVAREENKCWGDWLNNDSPNSGDGDEESRPGECPKPSLYDCQDLDGRSMNDLELNLTIPCLEDGIKCLNSEQRPGRSCPDFKVRFVCPCPVNSACSSNPCGQHGTCEHLPVGYKCKCNDGYEGRNCETANKCPYLDTIANGMETGSRNIGDTTTITCNAGFKPNGASTLTCVGGRWDAPVPQCVDVDECTEGGASCAQGCVNTIGSYKCKCNAGYALQADGKCTDINECDTNNGNCQQSCYNSVGSYRCACASGYHLTADGRSCEDDDECSNGLGPCDQICINSLASFQCLCRPGYTLNGDGTTCQASSCAAISSPAHGSTVPANPDTSVDSTVQFNCNTGYTLRGSSTRTCQADGAWSGITSTCQVIRCIVPGELLNGQLSSHDNTYNTVVTYSCNGGFRLVGSATRTCQVDGTWSGTHPRCIAANCPEPAVPEHGEVIGLQRNSGDTIRFECTLGYNIVGASYAICQQNGDWTAPPPTCQVVNCGAPPAVVNGQVHGSDFTYGANVTFNCNAANFKLSGSAKRTCQVDGTWSGTQPVCLENSCGDPGTPINGKKIGDSYKYHDVVTFECNEGYKLVGSSSRSCKTDNYWNGTQPTCEIIDCGDPGTPDNGERYGSVFTYGRTISYDCEPGYELTGSRSRTCQLDGQWTGSIVSCVVSSCGATLVGPSGSFKSPNYPNIYQSNAYCRWKISVPIDKKVMVTFQSFKTQRSKDVVEIYDGVSKQEITVLSGVYSNQVIITSESNAIDIKFITDGSDESEGFSATFEQVSCGGFITQLNEAIMSPNYPSNYPNSVTCAWSLNIGEPFQLEFEQFYTESAHDLLTGYSSLNSFGQNDLVFYMEGQRLNEPVQVSTGKMHLLFKSNYRLNYPGFKFTIRKYQVIVGGK